ncbi:serine hydrolase [Streptomyces sp. NPDC088196]|uniref:serine hydrolase domain-containing protein n=1 Tax=Streptomyces sp. NPDC088196 TaxID=3154868 RepID=UPI00344E525C
MRAETDTGRVSGEAEARRCLQDLCLQDLMHTLSVEGTPPAIAVARGVRDRGVIRTRTGDACRNGGPRRRIDEDTPFDAASLTKIMCALPVTLRPHGAGLIGPDGAVTTWLPDLATPFGGRMTVRHLPTHTAGLIPHREYRRAFRGYEALLNAVLNEDPSAPPGTLCACSDLGCILLGEILRRVAHADPPDLVDEHVRGPLGPRAASFTSVERQRRRDRGEGRCRRPSPSGDTSTTRTPSPWAVPPATPGFSSTRGTRPPVRRRGPSRPSSRFPRPRGHTRPPSSPCRTPRPDADRAGSCPATASGTTSAPHGRPPPSATPGSPGSPGCPSPPARYRAGGQWR